MSKELKKRILTSIILITIVLTCIFINNFSWLVLLAIISLISWFEFINLINKIWKKTTPKYFLIFLSFSFLFYFSYTAYKLKINEGEMFLIFILLVCIFSDIGGYVVGKSIGGVKLTKISPNKTISGSIGSFLFSLFPLGIFVNFGSLIALGSFSTQSNYRIVLLCLTLSFACQIGDLIISIFKRLSKVKDTGKILPGHGGMLDRVDGIIFAIPVMTIFY